MRGLYYRRKVALALIEAFGGSLSRTKFQKLLFLVTQKQEEKSYNFVPYKYGCFSFQSNEDREVLILKGLLSKDDKSWVLSKRSQGYLSALKDEDRENIIDLRNEFHNKTQKDLVRFVYTKYPYYAVRSEIADQILTPKELLSVKESNPKNSKKVFYTIGYEGKSIELYINELIKADVKLLCDVRKNPLSRKFGFSKKQLSEYLSRFDIHYIHIPALGIESDKRKGLGESVTHQMLFRDYKKVTIPRNRKEIFHLIELLKQYKRIAITCFEADHNYCHRGCVADEISKLLPAGYEIANL